MASKKRNARKKELTISVVVPVYHGEATVVELVHRLKVALAGISARHEIILVDDGSPDGAWEKITVLARRFPGVVGVRLSRNFGQHYAITAGLSLARGKSVVVMDCDLQDQPSQIPKMIKKALEGYDVVLARRAERKDEWAKRFGSYIFYAILSWLSGVRHDAGIANFGVYSSKVIQAINQMPETIRYFPTMVRWVGFRGVTVDVEHGMRPHGTTSYNFKKLFNLALDICLAYSDKPLRVVVGTGFLVSIIGIILALVTLLKALQGKITVLGYASLIVSLWTLAGLTIFIMGIVGLYVGKCFEGIKRRPSFIIAEKIN
jgi:dolichol-phosphate mannosyltransferase